MTVTKLRQELKKAIDSLPPDRLATVADFVGFLKHRQLSEAVSEAETDLKAGRGVNWRKVRKDV